MLAKNLTAAALFQFSKGVPIPVLIYLITGIIIAWIYVGLSFQSHQCGYQGNNICLKIVHSFVLALMIRPISPTYLIVKERKSFRLLIWGTLAHILVDLIGISLVLLRLGHFKERESPCHSLHLIGMKEESNKYLTCNMFLGATFLSILVFIFTSILFIWLYMKNDDYARDILETSTSRHIECNKTSPTKIYPVNNVKLRSLHHLSTPILIKLLLVVIVAYLIRELQIKSAIKGKVKKY